MIEDRYAGAVEAMLFASGDAIELADIAAVLGTDKRMARKIVEGLAERYELENRGIQIAALDDAYQMRTSPDYHEFIESLGKTSRKKALTPAVMETLAIIAYKQPATKADIENIRGVGADHAVNKLVEFGLVQETGRADAPGRPVMFGTSEEFLRYFGISSLKELPGLPAVETVSDPATDPAPEAATDPAPEAEGA